MSDEFGNRAFGGHAEAYASARITYPLRLYEEIEALLPPELRGKVVDLGSGTGISALPLLERFKRVVAVEVDHRMAQRIPAHPRLEVRIARAEDVELPARSVDLVTCGTAFHWMDGPHVLDRARLWLKEGGLLALFRYGLPDVPGQAAAVVARELRERWNAYRHERLRDEDHAWKTVCAAPGWERKRRARVDYEIAMSGAELARFLATTSYAAAYASTLDVPGAYREQLERELEGVSQGRKLSVGFPIELITASPAS